MKKSIKSIMMCVLVFMMCLTFADTAKADLDETLYILGQEVTGDTATGDGWKFERAKDNDSFNKLYLTNANLVVDNNVAIGNVDGQAIQMWADLEIILSGTNTITMKATDVSDVEYYDAIDANELIFSGNGTLNIKYDELATNSVEIYCIYSESDLTIEENVKLNIECSTITKKDPDWSAYIDWYGLTSDALLIQSNAQVNISNLSFEGDTRDDFYGEAINCDELTIGKNGKVNIEIGDISAYETILHVINTYYSILCDDNAQINIKANNISGGELALSGIETSDFIIGNNVNISVDMGNITGSGKSFAILSDYINTGSNCTFSAIASNNQCDKLQSIGIGCISLHPEKDSIIKCYGEQYAIMAKENLFDYPIYGGNKKNDVNQLTSSMVTYNGMKYEIPMYGDTPAKYAEIGNLLTINLKCTNGTVNKTSFTMHNGRAVGTLPTPVSSRKDYTFTGWYTAATGGTKVYSTTKLTKSMTLYAQWKKITYTINFNANGGTVGVEKKWVEYGNPMEFMPTPKREGYTFTGWYTAKTGGTKVYSTTKPTKSMTLYAQWKIKTYTINFDGNSGTVGVAKKWVDHGNAMEFMPTPKRDGYTFTGWYTAKTGGSKVYSTTKVTKNMTLYAQWKKNSCTITFNANGGKVSTASKTVNGGTAIGTMPTPTRSGYTFTGWFTAKTGGTKVYSTTKVTNNMTLYAQWKK